MNKDITSILKALTETPRILNELISEIDEQLIQKEIVKGKWTIHEHATHIAITDLHGFQERLFDFKIKQKPKFTSLSGDNYEKDFYLNLNLKETLKNFSNVRQRTIELALSLREEDWSKQGIHPEYKNYTPYILIRHLLMHDHNHLYKIEDMGFGIGHVK